MQVAVHTAILDDLVYPAEIVGKRTRIRLDGSRLYKIHLDKNQQTNIEHKVSGDEFMLAFVGGVCYRVVQLTMNLKW